MIILLTTIGGRLNLREDARGVSSRTKGPPLNVPNDFARRDAIERIRPGHRIKVNGDDRDSASGTRAAHRVRGTRDGHGHWQECGRNIKHNHKITLLHECRCIYTQASKHTFLHAVLLLACSLSILPRAACRAHLKNVSDEPGKTVRATSAWNRSQHNTRNECRLPVVSSAGSIVFHRS